MGEAATMLDLFEELQTAFDKSAALPQPPARNNLFVCFTAMNSDCTLAGFGEFVHVNNSKDAFKKLSKPKLQRRRVAPPCL